VDELIRMIQEKTGIDEAQARGAAQTAIDFIKQRLPEPMRGQIDGLLGGGGAGGAMPDLGGMLGGR
jgi:hypothetical protein